MNDSTARLLEEVALEAVGHPQFALTDPMVYNIDDMDPRAYMIDRNMSGCYGIASGKEIDPAYPGNVWINGVKTGQARLGSFRRNRQAVGFFVRPFFREYGTEYHILYEGAVFCDGTKAEPLKMDVRTLPKVKPGEKHPEHDGIVLQAAREGAVLLKNENGALPLAKGSVVNVFGKGGPSFRLGCVGAGKINPRYGIRVEEGIGKYSSLRLNKALFDFYRAEEDILPPAGLLEDARKQSDTAVFIITRGTGEAVDNLPEKGGYYLTDAEEEMLRVLAETFAHTVVVLNTGYPLGMGWEERPGIDAVLWTGLPGMAAGAALAEILEGTVSPSGRLPDTWAYRYEDYPSAKDFCLPNEHTVAGPFGNGYYAVLTYSEDIYVGYRYFETFGKKAAYPFGYGLSYTEFETKAGMCVDYDADDGFVQITAEVKNVGKYAGKEVVEIYAGIPDGKLEQPAKRLVAFAKTALLQPGESARLTIPVSKKRFESYDETTASWLIEKGTIELYLGKNAHDTVGIGSVVMEKDEILRKVENRVTPPFKIQTLTKKAPEDWKPGAESGYFKSEKLPFTRERKPAESKNPVRAEKPEEIITFPMLIDHPELAEAFAAQMDDYDLARMSVGARPGWGATDNGFAGTLFTGGALEKYEIPEYYFSDGNNGLNMFEATIGFPVSNVMCASFNTELLYGEGKAIGEEAPDLNLHCILAPAMNLHRNILCGRHSEYFSEDPYLAGVMAGYQGKGFEDAGQSACYKHFFANNAETIRSFSHSIMTERAAREIYLRVFENAMEIHEPDSFMTGYNAANGVYCAGDGELLQGILREEWGFKGYVMTDWGSVFRCGPVETAAAGNSWIAPGSMDDSQVLPIVQAMADGSLSRERVRENVRDMAGAIARRLHINRSCGLSE